MPPKKPTIDLSKIDLDFIKGEQSRRSLKDFVVHFWPYVERHKFLDNWHLDVITDHLANAFQIKNLIINLPPRCCKSLITGVFWPAWLWLHQPETKFLFASYGLDLAEDTSEKCRQLIGSPLFAKLFSNYYKLSTETNTKLKYDTNKGGRRHAISTCGGTTGFGADALIIDDAHNAKKAESELERENVIRWFTQAFYNRLDDARNGCRVVIGQRVHRNDLSGFLLENFASDWTHVNLAWEYKPSVSVQVGHPSLGHTDPRTKEGEWLWKDRFPEQEVRFFKRNWATFETQYNQNPVESEHVLFKPDNFTYYDDLATTYKTEGKTINKAQCFRVVSADLAISTEKRADYTAVLVADIASTGEIILVHCLRDKMPGTKLVPALQQINETFRPAYFLVEDVAFQKVIIEQARMAGLAVRGVKPDTDKQSRSIPLQIRFENKQVWFPKEKPFVEPLERELVSFPNGAHDDMVDALAYLAIEANKRTRGRSDKEEVKPTKSESELYQEWLWADVGR